MGALAACGGDDDEPAADAPAEDALAGEDVASVAIDTFQFEPDPVVVQVGDTVTWVNEDATEHTVTQGTRDSPTAGGFDGSLPEEGSTFVATFDEAGSFAYYCRIHAGMSGTVTVE